MPGVAARIARLYFVDNDGFPLVGGFIETYAAGTLIPKPTWQDRALTVLNTNPIELDGRGSGVIWLEQGELYKIVVKNRAEVTQWTQDNVEGGMVDTSLELGAAALQAAGDAAAAAAASAAASLAASQLLASGSRVSEEPFTGPGPWIMPVPFTAITAVYVSGRKWRMNNFSVVGNLVVNISDGIIPAAALVDIQYV